MAIQKILDKSVLRAVSTIACVAIDDTFHTVRAVHFLTFYYMSLSRECDMKSTGGSREEAPEFTVMLITAVHVNSAQHIPAVRE